MATGTDLRQLELSGHTRLRRGKGVRSVQSYGAGGVWVAAAAGTVFPSLGLPTALLIKRRSVAARSDALFILA